MERRLPGMADKRGKNVKDRMMKKQKEKRYTMLQNDAFIYKQLWNFDKKVIFYAIAESFFLIVASFLAVIAPSLVVGMLEDKVEIAYLIQNITILFVMIGVITGISDYLKERNGMQYVKFRSVKCMKEYELKGISINYGEASSKEVQELKTNGEESFWSNNWGLEGILHNHVTIVVSVVSLILYVTLISSVNFWMTLVLLVVSILQLAGTKLASQYEKKCREEKAGLEVTKRYLQRKAYETKGGKDVRLYQLQDWLNGKYHEANLKYKKILQKKGRRYFANDLFGLFLQLGRDGICYGFLIYQLQQGMKVADFVLYIGIVGSFSAYFTNLTDLLSVNIRCHEIFRTTRKFLEYEDHENRGTGDKLTDVQDALEITFSHVSFAYPGADHNTLDDISFTMKQGEKFALVGINGAGKTTIVNLICGFYRPTKGTILVNGKDLLSLDMEDYRKYLAVVFQETVATSYSIIENITCAPKEQWNEEKCRDALNKAGLYDKISSLPKKEYTCLNKDVEEDGILLSGGEMQKLLLARALYKDCRLLLLDEPTAALDAIAENEMYENYQELMKGRTSLFISHRLASTRFCDQILFLENGKIVEQGTHEELMELGGKYAYMFDIQSQYYKEGEVA